MSRPADLIRHPSSPLPDPHGFDAHARMPWWLRDGHSQTIIPARLTRRPRVSFRRERWDTPDGDFIDLDWYGPHDAHAPPVLVLH